MSHEISTALTALRAAQIGIDTVGQNIANANTPGYQRQVVRLATRPSVNFSGHEIGTGVQVAFIESIRADVLEASLLQHESDIESIDAQLQTARHLEALIGSGAGSLTDGMDRMYQAMEELSARPHDTTGRRQFLATVEDLASTFRRLSNDLYHVRERTIDESRAVVEEVNRLMGEIGHLNAKITAANFHGRSSHGLENRRNAFVRELAGLIDVRPNIRDGALQVGDGSIFVGHESADVVELRETEQGVFLFEEGSDRPITIQQGKLSGLLDDVNFTVQEVQSELDRLAAATMKSLDEIHAQGVGIDGPLLQASGDRFVLSSTEPLASVLPAENLINETITINIIDLTTGARVPHTVEVQPEVDTITSLAAEFSLPGLFAEVDSATGNLSISANSGFGFDFAGSSTETLAALGINTLFVGNDASTIAVNPRLWESPERLATSFSGDPGDSRNLTAMIESRDQAYDRLDGRTLGGFLGDIVASHGATVASLEHSRDSLDAVRSNVESQIQSISGVDADEEVLRMIQYQRAYEAAARFLSTINEMTDELLNLVR